MASPIKGGLARLKQVEAQKKGKIEQIGQAKKADKKMTQGTKKKGMKKSEY